MRAKSCESSTSCVREQHRNGIIHSPKGKMLSGLQVMALASGSVIGAIGANGVGVVAVSFSSIRSKERATLGESLYYY